MGLCACDSDFFAPLGLRPNLADVHILSSSCGRIVKPAMELSRLESYVREAKDPDITRYTIDRLEAVSTANLKSKDSAAASDLDTILQTEKKVTITQSSGAQEDSRSVQTLKDCLLVRFDADGILGSNLADIAIYPLKAFELQETGKEERTMEAGERYILRRNAVHKAKSSGAVVWLLLR